MKSKGEIAVEGHKTAVASITLAILILVVGIVVCEVLKGTSCERYVSTCGSWVLGVPYWGLVLLFLVGQIQCISGRRLLPQPIESPSTR